MATWMGLEPTTSAVTGRRSNQLNYQAEYCAELFLRTIPHHFGGNNRARTYDPLLVRQMLSQLSYAPIRPILLGFRLSFENRRPQPTCLFYYIQQKKSRGFSKKIPVCDICRQICCFAHIQLDIMHIKISAFLKYPQQRSRCGYKMPKNIFTDFHRNQIYFQAMFLQALSTQHTHAECHIRPCPG